MEVPGGEEIIRQAKPATDMQRSKMEVPGGEEIIRQVQSRPKK